MAPQNTLFGGAPVAASAPTAGMQWSTASPAPSPSIGFRPEEAPQIEVSITEVRVDGSFGETQLVRSEVTIGRENCDFSYPADALVSPVHARIQLRDRRLFLSDQGSRHGTFIKLRQDAALAPGRVFLLGRNLFRLSLRPPPGAGLLENRDTAATLSITDHAAFAEGIVTVEQVRLDGTAIQTFSLNKSETTFGRTRGDLVFRDDPYMSGLHARIVGNSGRFILQDLKSRNGVYLRIEREVELEDGNEFFLGEQLFRVNLRRPA